MSGDDSDQYDDDDWQGKNSSPTHNYFRCRCWLIQEVLASVHQWHLRLLSNRQHYLQSHFQSISEKNESDTTFSCTFHIFPMSDVLSPTWFRWFQAIGSFAFLSMISYLFDYCVLLIFFSPTCFPSNITTPSKTTSSYTLPNLIKNNLYQVVVLFI